MIKGINRSIIEINETGNQYIERAILFVNPTKKDDSKSLNADAMKYLQSLTLPKYCKKAVNPQKKRKDRIIAISAKILSCILLVFLGVMISLFFKM